jgi:hypothetical protein
MDCNPPLLMLVYKLSRVVKVVSMDPIRTRGNPPPLVQVSFEEECMDGP